MVRIYLNTVGGRTAEVWVDVSGHAVQVKLGAENFTVSLGSGPNARQALEELGRFGNAIVSAVFQAL